MSSIENRVIKKKTINKEINLKVYKNDGAQRIFVEFSTLDGKMVLQKSFQSTFSGIKEAEDFQEMIKSLNDLKAYFGIKEKKNVAN